MFESYEEAERNSGFKGFIARHFGPVIYADIAEEGIRQIAVVFMVLYILSGLLGMVAYSNVRMLVGGIVFCLAALALYWSKSRTAAIVLFALALVNTLLLLPAPLPWLWVAFGARAIQLTFGLHRLRRTRTEVLTALE